MNKTRVDTVIEVWNTEYIDYPSRRHPEDVDAEIVQIEVGNNGDYMVEVLRSNE